MRLWVDTPPPPPHWLTSSLRPVSHPIFASAWPGRSRWSHIRPLLTHVSVSRQPTHRLIDSSVRQIWAFSRIPGPTPHVSHPHSLPTCLLSADPSSSDISSKGTSEEFHSLLKLLKLLIWNIYLEIHRWLPPISNTSIDTGRLIEIRSHRHWFI